MTKPRDAALPNESARPRESGRSRESIVVLLMRHGQIVQEPTDPDSPPGAHPPRRFVGDRDLPLDETGRAQAGQAARALAGLPIRRAIASTLCRSIETAQIALSAVSPSPSLDTSPALREICLGQWQGLYPSQVRRDYPGQWEARGQDLARFRPPGGENFSDLADRGLPALIAHARCALSQGDPVTLAVAHAGLNLSMLCRLMDIPLQSALALPQDYCCLNILVWNETFQHMAVRAMNLLPAALGPGWAEAYEVG